MGKKSRVKQQGRPQTGREASRQDGSSGESGTPGAVGPRQPCPCGSGRRYKACHGSADGPPPTYVARPFEGLNGECDLVAMREYVPAATASVTVRGHEDRTVRLCSLLPGAAPALVRPDGTVWLGLQVLHGYGDASRDLAFALEAALAAEPGDDVVVTSDPGEGPRLQDLLVDEPLRVEVHEGFDYWLEGVDDADGSMAAVLEQANATISPTLRLASVPAAYWADSGGKEFLRWAMPQPEDELLDALARLHVARRDRLVEDARLIGMFRTHGLLVPVWELPAGTGAEALEDPATDLLAALAQTLTDAGPLGAEERSARAGLANRQLTLR